MASRIMHYVIACIVADSIQIKDRKNFILGNLEPDISNKKDGGYDRAHFLDTDIEKGVKGINWRAFADKYKDAIREEDELLGYFSHLIADAVWLKEIRDRNIRQFTGEERKRRSELGYQEMYRYNAILIKKYKLLNEITEIATFKADEVDEKGKGAFLTKLAKDFDENEGEEYNFEVYPYDQIMNYIAFVTQKIQKEIEAVKQGREGGDPREFYVRSKND